MLPWTKLKPLIILKLEKVVESITNEEEDLSFLDEKIQVAGMKMARKKKTNLTSARRYRDNEIAH